MSAAIRPVAKSVRIDEAAVQLCIALTNGGELRFPLQHFPRLARATPEERQQWTIWGGGQFVRWDVIDEDISVPQLLAGVCSWTEIAPPTRKSRSTTLP